MSLIAALLLAASSFLTVTPVKGTAPFEPTITITIQGPFTGAACVLIDDLETPENEGLQGLEFCQDVSIGNGATYELPFPLTAGRAGKYELTGVLIGDKIQWLNSVKVTVE